MTSPTSATRTHRSRKSHSPAIDNPDKAAKAVATADVIGQRMTSLIRHLTSLDPQQLAEVAEPVLERLSAVVSTIHDLHEVFAGWAADHTERTEHIDHRENTDADVVAEDRPMQALADSERPTVDHDDASADSVSHHSTPADRGGKQAGEPASTGDHPDVASEPGAPGDAMQPTPPATAADPGNGHANNTVSPAGQIHREPTRQAAPLHTVADLRHALGASADDAPIRVLHGGTTYALAMPADGGPMILIDLADQNTARMVPIA
ncbi:hypothetical protein HDA40_002138 [Hamadaea flava]|uniref:Uncharacterized protein n=1 Tax=Hamadaea flava TaxID=1742688 RepID=A0ABV8LLJ8_9ACTN|nr:hypothetical protein [Hamadaea flava]MCP2323631.1 hypothetical protein [Hamadaea flava]